MQHAAEDPGTPGTSAPLKIDSFSSRIGNRFAVTSANGSQELRLARAEPLPGSVREGGGFRLEFLGAPEQFLPQAVYAFAIDGAIHDIFIVPLGHHPEGEMRYEAIFF